MLIIACDEKPEVPQINDPAIQEIIARLSTQEDTIQLVELLFEKIVETKDSSEKSDLLENGIFYSKSLPGENMLFSMEYIKNSFSTLKTPEVISDLAKKLKESGKSDLALIMEHSLMTNFPTSSQASNLQNDQWKSISGKWLENKRAELVSAPDSAFNNKDKIIEYINICEGFAYTHPNDTLSENLLFEAAGLSRSLNSFAKSVSLYDGFLKFYPDSKNAADALFIKGFILDNHLGAKKEAEVSYTQFLRQFPNHERVKDARFLLENLYTSAEQLMDKMKK